MVLQVYLQIHTLQLTKFYKIMYKLVTYNFEGSPKIVDDEYYVQSVTIVVSTSDDKLIQTFPHDISLSMDKDFGNLSNVKDAISLEIQKWFDLNFS